MQIGEHKERLRQYWLAGYQSSQHIDSLTVFKSSVGIVVKGAFKGGFESVINEL